MGRAWQLALAGALVVGAVWWGSRFQQARVTRGQVTLLVAAGVGLGVVLAVLSR